MPAARVCRLSGPLPLPPDCDRAEVTLGRSRLTLTNLAKPFWPELGLLKRDLLSYYAAIAPALLPHLRDRAMVMKRYPNGAAGEYFFMKRVPVPHPEWIETCSIEHASGNVIDFPMAQDAASLLWIVNLGCIDLNPWYARCADVHRPDYLHFDLDPTPGAGFEQVRETALAVKAALDERRLPSYAKTTGSRGIHIYVPIAQGPLQKQVWTYAKALARELAARRPDLITAEYRVAKRPRERVLVDYNQNAWGRTLASVYSVRPTPAATVSAPVTWEEVERGFDPGAFTLRSLPDRLQAVGDLWKPVCAARGRAKLEAAA